MCLCVSTDIIYAGSVQVTFPCILTFSGIRFVITVFPLILSVFSLLQNGHFIGISSRTFIRKLYHSNHQYSIVKVLLFKQILIIPVYHQCSYSLRLLQSHLQLRHFQLACITGYPNLRTVLFQSNHLSILAV